MFTCKRRLTALSLGALALLVGLDRQAQAQQRPVPQPPAQRPPVLPSAQQFLAPRVAAAPFRQPIVVPPNTFVNPNFYVNPYMRLPQFAYNTAVLGRALAVRNQAVLNTAFANQVASGGFPYGGLGYLGGSGGLGSLGGYGALLANTGYGGYGMSGYGYGTNWMQNPYQGYLTGAASLTKANAQYQLTIQQARLIREEATSSHMDTRRKIIEEAEYERAHLPDPEKIRQNEIARELEHVRFEPTSTEVSSGRALNTLLRQLIKQQGRDVKGNNVPLSEDTLKSVNVAPATSRANPGLLKDKGRLQWPQPLMDTAYKDVRQDLNLRLKDAVQQAQTNANVDPGTLKDLRADLLALNDRLEAHVGTLSPSRYIEARRYLNLLGDAVKALEDPNATNFLNQRWMPKGRNVAELVDYMRQEGLQFAPAAPGDEPAYRGLFNALAAFDASMPQAAQSSGEGNGK